MKIKQTRQVRLDELLQIIWSNPSKYAGTIFKSHKMFPAKVQVSVDGCGIKSLSDVGIGKSGLFTITEEVEITEESLLDIVVIDDYKVSFSIPDISIREAIEKYISPKFIYLQNPDGSIGELIWDKERGLVD